MVDISDRKIEIVRTLVETAPDKIVDGLQRALAETGGDTILAKVRQLVEAEAADRTLRNAVFQPAASLFAGDGSDPHRLVFPARTLALLWRGLKALAPDEVAAAAKASAAIAAAIANEQRLPDPSRAFDALLLAAAGALRGSDRREFRTAVEICDAARPGGGEALAACLDVGHIVRRTLPRLEDWVARPGEETGAAARLAYKDAVAVAEDAGPRFFEMLAGQLAPPWMVLRIISSIMDKPTERYLAESELGGFPERVMAEIDAALKAIGQLDLDGGPAAGRAAGRLVELITQQTFELEVCIELTRESGWGKRIVGQKKALANLVEARLRETEKLLGEALPMESSGMRRPRKSGPKLDEAPDPKAVGRAMTALTLFHEIRLCANYGGFSAAHTKVGEALWSAVNGYVADVLDHLRTGDVTDVAIAHAYLLAAADVAALVRDEAAAELVRRRAVVACTPTDNTIVLDA
ncbi:hypothetical protein [Phenylobacterium sp.]|uniref:hypothetical protein n=1 Tax=Phenylobacterium sp. TaxID=1871053 RepID=UPI00374D0D40